MKYCLYFAALILVLSVGCAVGKPTEVFAGYQERILHRSEANGNNGFYRKHERFYNDELKAAEERGDNKDQITIHHGLLG